jgi:hypothetical protein
MAAATACQKCVRHVTDREWHMGFSCENAGHQQAHSHIVGQRHDRGAESYQPCLPERGSTDRLGELPLFLLHFVNPSLEHLVISLSYAK